jgi:hypothetical protein
METLRQSGVLNLLGNGALCNSMAEVATRVARPAAIPPSGDPAAR